MNTILDLKKERENKHSILFKSVGLFFAFSNTQFEESKTTLKEGDKYVSIGAGGYLPKSNVDEFLKGMSEISKWYKKEIKNNKASEKEVAYELSNHECFYTNDISDVVEMFKGIYTKEFIQKVYEKEKVKYREYMAILGE
jgi:hypothetical protein